MRDPDNGECQDNYRRGFFSAPNADSRYVCLLYENTIAVPAGPAGRIDVLSPSVRTLLRDDFAAMARFLVEIRDQTPSRVFLLDDRPVIFVFASHAWGIVPAPDNAFDFVGELREVFRDIYGVPPFLIGDELFLAPTGRLARESGLRTVNFDAIYRYHHAAFKPGAGSTAMSTPYVENQIALLRRIGVVVSRLRNRFTGRQPLVIPNMAPGFAKPGYPTLEVGRAIYADFLKRVRQAHMEEHVIPMWQEGHRLAVASRAGLRRGVMERGVRGPYAVSVRVQPLGASRGPARVRPGDGGQGGVLLEPLRQARHHRQSGAGVRRPRPVPGECLPQPCA